MEGVSKGLSMESLQQTNLKRFNSKTFASLMKGSKAEAMKYLESFNKKDEKKDEFNTKNVIESIKNDNIVIPNVQESSLENTENESNVNISNEQENEQSNSVKTEDVTITVEDRAQLRSIYEELSGKKAPGVRKDDKLIKEINNLK